MGCFPRVGAGNDMPIDPGMLQLHTSVSRPLTASGVGSIACYPVGRNPIRFRWILPAGVADCGESADGSELSRAPPGEYRVEAEDAAGYAAGVSLVVRPLQNERVVVVESYEVTNATSASARDGRVKATGAGFREAERAHVRFLWTHGTVTKLPELLDVPPGRYALVAVSDGEPLPWTTVHTCAPGVVGAS